MGYITRLKTSEIRPREFDTLISGKRLIYLCDIIDCYLSRKESEVVPVAVKKTNNEYVVVDGHHRLLVADLFRGEAEVYIPSHNGDFFTEKMIPGVPEFMRNDLNNTIRRIYNLAEKISWLGQGVSFSDIRNTEEFWFLKDIEAATEFHKIWKTVFQENPKILQNYVDNRKY